MEARIKQHIPAYVVEDGKNAKKKKTNQKQKKQEEQKQKKMENNQKEEEERKAPDSAIGEHLFANVGCLKAYDRKQFAILVNAKKKNLWFVLWP